MNRDVSPSPEPDPHRLSLESLEEKLRALPLAQVPGNLPSKLIAAIPPAKALSSHGSRVFKRWAWIGAVVAVCMAISPLVYWWLLPVKPANGVKENRGAAVNSTIGKDAPQTSKAVQDFEQAVRFDPYNADAWFSLAKAQAEVHRADDAISSAQKAIDIARSRNRSDLAETVESWLRSYRSLQTRGPPP